MNGIGQQQGNQDDSLQEYVNAVEERDFPHCLSLLKKARNQPGLLTAIVGMQSRFDRGRSYKDQLAEYRSELTGEGE